MTMFSCSEQTDNVYEESYVIQHKLIQVMRTLKGNVGADLIQHKLILLIFQSVSDILNL